MTDCKITKAVIPVAGFGTRMLPASKAIPKELLPVVDEPAIQYVVNEAVAAGITEIVLVSHASKAAIENHFDGHPELEAQLEAKGKDALLKRIRETIPESVRVISVRQGKPRGLGHAVACAASVVGDAPFVVILPDVLVDDDVPGRDLSAMLARYQETGAAQIMVEKVPDDRVDQYGIVDMGAGHLAAGESQAMRAVVEKPPLDKAPSNWSVVGRYVLPGQIFSLLDSTLPGAGGEIQLTDAIASLIETQQVEAYGMQGRTFDCGSKLGYLEAVLHYSLKHSEVGPGMQVLLNRYANKREG